MEKIMKYSKNENNSCSVLKESFLLKENDLNKITNTVLDYLENTGVQFEKNQYVFDLFLKAGCTVSENGFIKIPSNVLLENLNYCVKSFKWWNKAGTDCLNYGGGDTYFIADSRAPAYIDPHTMERKNSDKEGLAKLVKLIDVLPEFDICGVPITTSDFLKDNYTVIENTEKPMFLNSGDDSDVLKKTVEAASEIRGGLNNFKEKPFFATLISPLVLYYPSFVCENIRLSVENNIPVFIASMPIGGVSSPVTIAGTLIVCLATTLPGIMLAQLIKKGHPCTESSYPVFMDPQTGGIGGYPENSMADSVRIQICKKLGIPVSQQTALVSGSKNFNQDAMLEIILDMERLQSSAFDSFWGAGTLDSGLVYSPHALVYANEIISLTRRAWKGISIDEEDCALDLINQIKNGLYTSEEHTALNARKNLWRGKYSLQKGQNDSETEMSERPYW